MRLPELLCGGIFLFFFISDVCPEKVEVLVVAGSQAVLPCKCRSLSSDSAIICPHLSCPCSTVWRKQRSGLQYRGSSWAQKGTQRVQCPHQQFERGDFSLQIDAVTKEDGGTYTCMVDVGRWVTQSVVTLRVLTVVQTKEKGSVTLSCQLSDSSDVTKYDWVQTTSDPNGTESVRSVLKGKTVRISPESEQNQWTCRFYGKEGVLGNITRQAQLIGGLTGPGKSSVPSRNTPTVVGLSLLLLVLLLVLAQMYKNHQRRKRIFQYPALETMVHNISNEREEKNRNRAKK